MNVKITLIYINVIIIVLSIISISALWGIEPSLFSKLSVIAFLPLLVLYFREFTQTKYFKILMLYLCGLFVSLTLNKDVHLSLISTYFCPFFICSIIKGNELRFFRPLFYMFLLVFIINAVAAFIERYIGFWIVPVSWKNDVLLGQMITDDMDIVNFRAFAFFGHPLTNGNVMAFMSFIILYTKSISIKIRFLLFAIGMASLFCFNTRGAILVSAILLVPAVINYLKSYPRYRIVSLLCFAVIAYILYNNFENFGGRLANSDINDSNSAVRLAAIDEFFSLSFSDLLSGGYSMKNGENGILMILAYYGLLVGSIKVFVEIYLSYKLIKNDESKIHKWVIMLSLIAVASTNNNLATVLVVPFYILFMTFVMNNQPSLTIQESRA